jgi:hypothetical protein
VCIQAEPKESMVNSCLDPRPGRTDFLSLMDGTLDKTIPSRLQLLTYSWMARRSLAIIHIN